MDNKRFEYFLNAIHYFIWLADKKAGYLMRKIITMLFSPIPKYFFTKNLQKRYEERQKNGQKYIDIFFNDKERGYHIGWANHWFGYFYSGYPLFLSFIIMGIVYKSKSLNIFTILLIAAPVALCYIPAYKAVFTRDRYLIYFKKFEREDNEWHKKWKYITILFLAGPIVMVLLGILAMFLILYYMPL